MDHTLIQDSLEELIEPSNDLEELVEGIIEQVTPVAHTPSYHPTRWDVVNHTLEYVDTVSGGRAALIMRFVSYLFFGGSAALVNLGVFAGVLYLLPSSTSFNDFLRNLIASAIACEISLIANFIPNDLITFRHMPGHQRPWLARCGRFHVTSLSGSLLTILLQILFRQVFHVVPLLAQAIALILALFYNFSFHHLFTYRHVGEKKVPNTH